MSDEAKVKATTAEAEGIRAWYKKTTRSAWKALWGATLITGVIAVLLWTLASMGTLQHLQTFNGAIVIPAAGGIWIVAFIYLWLVPMRELSFRGQESLERTEGRFKDALEKWAEVLEKDLKPTLATWQRIGDAIEKELVPKTESVLDACAQTATVVRDKAAQVEKRAHALQIKVEPAIESTKRVAGQVERHVVNGILEKIQVFVDTVGNLNGLVPPPGTPRTRPDISRTLSLLRKPVSPPPAGRRPEPVGTAERRSS